MQEANEGRVAPRIDRPKPDEPLAGEIVCWSALEHRALDSELLSAEFFARTAALTQALLKRGLPCLEPLDRVASGLVRKPTDLRADHVYDTVLAALCSWRLGFVHFSPPVSLVASPGLVYRKRQSSAQEKGRQEDIAMRVAALIGAANQSGATWTLEAPKGAWIWSNSSIVAIRRLDRVYTCIWDMCAYGSAHKRPSQLLSNSKWLCAASPAMSGTRSRA